MGKLKMMRKNESLIDVDRVINKNNRGDEKNQQIDWFLVIKLKNSFFYPPLFIKSKNDMKGIFSLL